MSPPVANLQGAKRSRLHGRWLDSPCWALGTCTRTAVQQNACSQLAATASLRPGHGHSLCAGSTHQRYVGTLLTLVGSMLQLDLLAVLLLSPLEQQASSDEEPSNWRVISLCRTPDGCLLASSLAKALTLAGLWGRNLTSMFLSTKFDVRNGNVFQQDGMAAGMLCV